MADHRLDGSGYPRGLGGAALWPRCAGNHIEDIYIRTGWSSRAEASLHAMQQGLLASCARRKEPALSRPRARIATRLIQGVSDIAAAGGNGGTHRMRATRAAMHP